MGSPKLSNALDLDLQLAEKVYRRLLPKRLTRSGIDVVIRLRAFNRIGGDDATVLPTNDHRVYICVSDVRAHGISSALLVTRVNSFVRERVPSANHPCEIVEELNSFLCQNFGGLGMALSFFCGTVDRHRMEFTYAGCGHPPALHFKASARPEWKRLESQHTLLGVFQKSLSSAASIRCLSTRGTGSSTIPTALLRPETQRGNCLGSIRLAQEVGNCIAENLDGELLADRVLADVNRFQGGACRDDALLMMSTLQ